MAPEVIGSLVSAGGSLLGGLLGQGLNVSNMDRQAAISKDLMRYQWDNFSSPAAQIASLNKVGLGVNAYLGGKGSVGMPSGGMPSSAPVSFDGIADLGSIASYIQSVAQAKKAGMDTKLSEQEIKNKEIENQINEFELSLKKQFGKEFKSVELANAYRQLLLASDSHDLNVQEKALNEWKVANSKIDNEMLKQRLENNPTAIRLENQLMAEKSKTEKAQQAVSYSQAEINRETRRLNAALADIEENGKTEKIKSLIADYQARGLISRKDAEEARLKAQRLHDNNELRGDSLWRGIDDILDYLKDKVSIFK